MNLLSRFFAIFGGPDDRVRILVDDYLRKLDDGQMPDFGHYLTEHPEISVELTHALKAALEKRGDERFLTETLVQSTVQLETPPPLTPGAYEHEIFETLVPARRGDFPARRGIHGIEDTDSSDYPIPVTFGEYSINGELGRGAMGRVYHARKDGSNRDCALKTLQSGVYVDEKLRIRLKREGVAQQRLQHPNIVEIYEVGEIDEIPFLAMELIEGGLTLEHFLKRRQAPLSETETARIMLQLAQALTYSHQAGIVHRDIKPSNIMMSGDTPKLSDFGLAFVHQEDLTRITRSGEILGTLSYMSPEQVGGRHSDVGELPHGQSDIYSLGATMYEMLVGALPFHADTTAVIIEKILHADPMPPHECGVKLHPDVEAICIKCLEKSPYKRYYSAPELAGDLTRFLDGRPVEAPRVNWMLRRLRKSINRKRLAIAGAILGVLAAAGGLWLNHEYQYRDELTLLQEIRGELPDSGEEFELRFLLRAARESDVEYRISAMAALSRQHTEEANAALIALAADPDVKVRFNLARIMWHRHQPPAKEICRLLLNEPGGPVAAAAVKLAATLGDSSFIDSVRNFAYSHEKILRTYALNTTLRFLVDTEGYDPFIRDYFRDGPEEGKRELVNVFTKARWPPSIPVMIEELSASDAEIRAKAAETLAQFTNADFGDNQQQWRQWWSEFGAQWAAKRLLVVTWATPASFVSPGDIVWSINNQTATPNTYSLPQEEANVFDVIRDDTFLEVSGDPGPTKCQEFYIGVLNGDPVGAGGMLQRLRTVLMDVHDRPR